MGDRCKEDGSDELEVDRGTAAMSGEGGADSRGESSESLDKVGPP